MERKITLKRGNEIIIFYTKLVRGKRVWEYQLESPRYNTGMRFVSFENEKSWENAIKRWKKKFETPRN